MPLEEGCQEKKDGVGCVLVEGSPTCTTNYHFSPNKFMSRLAIITIAWCLMKMVISQWIWSETFDKSDITKLRSFNGSYHYCIT